MIGAQVIIAGTAKVDMPRLALFSALMFALPSLRNVACVAPIGSAFDFYGFFWVEFVAFMGLVVFGIKMYFDSLPPPPKDPEPAAAPASASAMSSPKVAPAPEEKKP